MNRIHALLVIAFTIINLITPKNVNAQSPQKINYQAVIRNSSNQLITGQTISIKISILKSTPTGTVVYTETQKPVTNSNGLIAIQIGGGTGFDVIDWSKDIYFIKTEVDPLGGTNYTVSGTSQILSVPYALHANTADSLKSAIPETDPIFGSSVAKSIKASDTAKWNNKSYSYNETDPVFNSSVAKSIIANDTFKWNHKLSNFTETDPVFNSSVAKAIKISDTAKWNSKLSNYTETDPIYNLSVSKGIKSTDTSKWNNKQDKFIAGTGININGNTISTTSNSGVFTHYIGELFGGGIVVAVWKDLGVEHGLIASAVDVGSGSTWSNITSTSVGSSAYSPFDGQANTNAIIAQSGHTTSAAKLCDIYTSAGFSDWYLPSTTELNQCYNAAVIVNNIIGASNGFQARIYWSSTESFYDEVWGLNFVNGIIDSDYKTNSYKIRAVRKF